MSNEFQEKKLSRRSVTTIAAALILAVGMGYGLSLVGTGLSSKAGNSITVTGSAKTSAVADNAVWTLNISEMSQQVSVAVKKIDTSTDALSKYLIAGGLDSEAIEVGGVTTYANNEYVNGNSTGRIISYQANQNVTVRSKDVPSTWEALLAGKSGVRKLEDEWAQEASVTFAARVAVEPSEVMERVEMRRLDRSEQFAMIASREAWKDAGAPDVDKERLGVVIASGIGGVITLLDQYDVLKEKGARFVSPHTVPMLMPNGPAANVGLELQARAGVHTPVSACASGAEAAGYALEMIRNNRADIVVTGGVEAAIHELPMAGFASMKALSTRNDAPAKASRPYDKDRDGFVLGEGGGVLVFEELEHAKARGAKIYAEVMVQCFMFRI